MSSMRSGVLTRLALLWAAGASAQAPTPSPNPTQSLEARLGVADRGIFPDLDARVQLELARVQEPERIQAIVDRARQQLVLYEDSWPVKVYPLTGEKRLELGNVRLALRPGDYAELAPLLAVDRLEVLGAGDQTPPGDADDDGIPDPLDVLIGAHKTLLNADRYDGRYQPIAYPGGDVPREIGVCTDVVIRALRNAGYDLQREVQEDIRRAPRAYAMVSRPNASIDHRRIKSLLPLFERHYQAHSPALHDPLDPLRPGDIVFMDTFPNRPGAEHVGIVSDGRGPNGLPLVINNWTEGTVTKPMDLLSWVPVTHRFRVPGRVVPRGPIAAGVTQLITVVSESWSGVHGQLKRYARSPGNTWQPIGAAIPIVLGSAGYGWGDGLHGTGALAGFAGPAKREGDRRSPAGLFELGMGHAYARAQPPLRIAYQVASEQQRCVDDPASKYYNQVVSISDVTSDWKSAERMLRDDDLYELAIEVLHNRLPVTAGHGSCIFLHVWSGPDVPVTGCTAMAKPDLWTLARWLEPKRAVLVALPQPTYRRLQLAWGLPPCCT